MGLYYGLHPQHHCSVLRINGIEKGKSKISQHELHYLITSFIPIDTVCCTWCKEALEELGNILNPYATLQYSEASHCFYSSFGCCCVLTSAFFLLGNAFHYQDLLVQGGGVSRGRLGGLLLLAWQCSAVHVVHVMYAVQ